MKIVLFIIGLLSIIPATAQKPYSISGKITGETPEQWIYIDKYMGDGSDYDSTKIVNGEFLFSGQVTTPELYCIFFDPSRGETRRYGMARIFVEPGDMTIDIDPKNMFGASTVKGGPVNKAYFDADSYMREHYYNKMDALARQSARAPREERDSLMLLVNTVQKELMQYNLDFINAHPDSPASLALLSAFYYTIPYTEVERILGQMSDDLKGSTVYGVIQKFAETQRTMHDKQAAQPANP